MTAWISEDITLTTPLVFDREDKNVVILGELTSDSDISIKVKNLVVFGKIITEKDISIRTAADFFNSGSIKGDNVSVVSASIYNGLNDLAIEKIRALGIDLTRSDSGDLSVTIPK